MVAVKGILSIIALENAEIQDIKSIASFSEVMCLTIHFPASSINPVSTSPPTMMKSPPKKNRVAHSTFSRATSGETLLQSNNMVAPVSATTAGSIPRASWKKNATIMSPMVITDFLKSSLSLIASSSLRFIIPSKLYFTLENSFL
ncbi:144aa long hypothetical protein [Pyrococcus horikoshii OT3]|uniref:Uncharacterized protein n=1 Tax=Pyrococcus horikoshii (strain ATCC 700860 / DSM 12428 / JCM 9974 / NBRC 100139 / OT-3) TaxID=70601 RepID=O59576_PYRHO|nr:144aa long hypothetical protein [Pyrococcus horikoshii OT3]